MKFSKKFLSVLLMIIFLTQFVSPIQLSAFAEIDTRYYKDIQYTKGVYKIKNFYPDKIISDFNSPEEVSKWKAGDNTDQINCVDKIADGPKTVYEGKGCLEEVPKKVKAYEWRKIYTEFSTPLNLSESNYLVFAADCWQWQNNDHILKVTLYNGSNSTDITFKIDPNSWNEYAIDLSGVNIDIKKNVTKMEISFVNNFNLSGIQPGAAGYDYWDGRFQIDYLCTAKTLDMDFLNNSEGFEAYKGKISVDNSILTYTPEGKNSYLVSPIINQDLSHRNSLRINMKNLTNANKIKISWTKDNDMNWDDSKSKIFDLTSDSGIKEYLFNMSDNSKWKGNLIQFKIEPISDKSITGSILIDNIAFDNSDVIKNYDGEITKCSIDDNNNINISGTIKNTVSNLSKKVGLFELATYEDAESLSNKVPIMCTSMSSNVNFNGISLNKNESNSRLYSKFVIGIQKDDGSYYTICAPKYISNPEKIADVTYDFPSAKDIKGLQVDSDMSCDSEEIGVHNAAINITYNSMLYKDCSNSSNIIPYVFDGQTYYFNKSFIEGLDNTIKTLTDKNILVTGILLLQADLRDDTPNKDLIDPDAVASGLSNACNGLVAFNTKNEVGVKYFKAITSFLAARYTRPDKRYGRMVNYIIGNEVGDNKDWYYMGPKLVSDYVKDYARTLRLANTVIKSIYSNARVYISLDHSWNSQNSPDSLYVYDNKKLVDMLTTNVNNEGNFGWNIAFHPYPENLFVPSFWNDKTATENFNTTNITFKNLDVLVKYIGQSNYLYNGQRRRIILSEQGFNSGSNSIDDQKLQAAAFAYAYYKVRFMDGIDAFILHRHVDHAGEGGLNLGLWTNKPGAVNDAYTQKYIYNVYKYIDTDKSLQVTDFAKKIIGINDWKDVIPNFNPDDLAQSKYPTEANAGIVKNAVGSEKMSIFKNDTDGWQAAENVSNVSVSDDKKYNGENVLKVSISSSDANDYKGILKQFKIPEDFSNKPVIYMDINPDNVIGNTSKCIAMIRAYSGDNVYKASTFINSGTWNKVGIDLSNWAYKNKVDKIKVWVRADSEEQWNSGSIYVGNISRAESADLINLKISANIPDDVQVGSNITFNITNNSNKSISGDMKILGLNGLEIDKNSSAINLKMNDTCSIKVNVKSLNIQPYKKGIIKLSIEGCDYEFNITDEYIPPVVDGDNKIIIGDFENTLDGWKADQNVDSIISQDADNCTGLSPASAVNGKSVLNVMMKAVNANEYKIIKKEFSSPIDISKSDVFRYSINSWGSPAPNYTTKLVLIGKDGSKFEKDNEFEANKWNNIEVDLNGCSFKNSIKVIEIEFKANSWNDPWQAHFFVDNIYSYSKDYCIGDFENYTDNWKAESNVLGLKSTEPGEAYAPAAAVSGNKYLSVVSSPALCTDLKSVSREFSTPVDMSGYNTFNYSIQCWGGVPGTTGKGYITILKLYDANGNVYKKQADISSDKWNDISIDIGDCNFKQAIKKVEIGFMANAGSIPWATHFYIDNVRVLFKNNQPATLSKVIMSADKTELNVNDICNLNLKGIMNDNSNADLKNTNVKYILSDDSVATIKDNSLKGIKQGSTYVYAIVTLNNVTIKSNVITIKVSGSEDNNNNTNTDNKSNHDNKNVNDNNNSNMTNADKNSNSNSNVVKTNNNINIPKTGSNIDIKLILLIGSIMTGLGITLTAYKKKY